MPQYDIEEWEREQAEVEIRRWLYSIGQWAPGAERLQPPELSGALSDEQIDQLLRSEVVGRIGCCAESKLYVVPVVYAYDGSCIYGHTNHGMKLRMMRANPEVCFEVDHMESVTSWQSVIAWGRFEELHGDAAEGAVHLLVQQMKPHLADKLGPAAPEQGGSQRRRADAEQRRAVVYRIVLRERTGRYEQR